MNFKKLDSKPLNNPNLRVNKFIAPNENFLICALNDGQFLGWDLSSNSLLPCAGIDQASLTSLTKLN